MSLSDPQGGMSRAAYRLALTLANCEEWIDWTGSLNASQAIDRAFFTSLPPPPGNRDSYTAEELQALRPFAIIWQEERGKGFRLRRSSSDGWDDGGRLHMVIEDNVPDSIKDDPQEIERRFLNQIGLVLGTEEGTTGLITLAHTAPDDDHLYLSINDIEFFGPFRADMKEATSQGDFVYGWLTIDWGTA